MTRLITIFFLLSPFILRSQNVDYLKFTGTPITTNLLLQTEGVSFLNYKKDTYAYSKFSSVDSVKINSIESFLSALVSANNLKWYEQYFDNKQLIDKVDKDFLNNRRDSTSNYYELLGKMTIIKEDRERTLIKIREVTLGKKKKPRVLILNKSLNTWSITKDNNKIEDYYYLMQLLNMDVFRSLMINKTFTDKYLETIRINTRTDLENKQEYLNLTKLVLILKSLQIKNSLEKLKKISDIY